MDLSFWAETSENHYTDEEDTEEATYNIDLISATELRTSFFDEDGKEEESE
jgi:hypothetical protein